MHDVSSYHGNKHTYTGTDRSDGNILCRRGIFTSVQLRTPLNMSVFTIYDDRTTTGQWAADAMSRHTDAYTLVSIIGHQ